MKFQFLTVSFLLATLFTFNLCAADSKPATHTETAIFAGGCFWCMQGPFDDLKNQGVTEVTVGYTGGTKDNPTYEDTSAGQTGHREAVQVIFDPTKLSYKKLLEVFWSNVDPVDPVGQFCDKGEQYTSAIFFTSEAQKLAIDESKSQIKKLLKVKGEIATAVLPAKKFYAAEDYHQSYYTKNPIRYKYYRSRCGRDDRLKEVWGKAPSH